MAEKRLDTIIVLKNDTKANWEAVKDTVTLRVGELGIESDTGLFKIGKEKSEGVLCTWAELEYANDIPDVDLTEVTNNVQVVTGAVEDLTAGKVVGDMGIVKTPLFEGSSEYSYTAYVWNGTAWAAMDGNYSAENVFTSKKITLAGSYTSIGNYSKGKVIDAGTSLQNVFSGLFQTTLQPSVTQPGASIDASGSQDENEVGTSYNLPTAKLKVTTGSYTYGPATGVKFLAYSENLEDGTFTGIKLTYGADPDAEGKAYSTNESDLGNNGEISLAPGAYNNSVTTALYTDADVSYTFSGKAYHTAGAVAYDNLDQPSNPTKQITAGAVTVADKTVKFRGFRYMYAGGTTATTIDSDAIRALGAKRKHTSKPSTSSYFEFTAGKGATKVIFAFPAGRMSGVSSPKFEIFTMAWGATEGFVKSTVKVADAREGENGLYDYDVYTYTPATPLAADSTQYRVYF